MIVKELKILLDKMPDDAEVFMDIEGKERLYTPICVYESPFSEQEAMGLKAKKAVIISYFMVH